MFDFIFYLKKLDKQKLIALAIGTCVFLYVDFAFVLSAQFKAAGSAKTRIAELRKNIGDIQAQSQQVAQKKQDLERNPVSRKTIMAANELPLLLQRLTVMAKENSVKIIQINHAKAGKIKDTNINSVMITLELVSGYHNLGGFISALENAEQPFAVETIRMRPDASEYQKEGITLGVKTYVQG